MGIKFVFSVTLIYLAKDILEIPSLVVATKYKVRKHFVNDSFVLFMMIPAMAIVWRRHKGH